MINACDLSKFVYNVYDRHNVTKLTAEVSQ